MSTTVRNLLTSPDAWSTVDEEPFASHGQIEFVRQDETGDYWLKIAPGDPGSGVNYRGPVPRMNYEIRAEVRRVEGEDFFYGLTFPIGTQHASLIVGGWSGGVWGISNLDGLSAVENETTGYQPFEQNQFYEIVLRVTASKITVELDGKRIINVVTGDHEYSVWPQQATMIPLGVATWRTGAEIRQLTLTQLPPAN